MQFLTIDQLARHLRADGEDDATVVRRIRLWVECYNVPHYQSRKGGRLRFRLDEVLAWLRKGDPLIAAAPLPSANPTPHTLPPQGL